MMILDMLKNMIIAKSMMKGLFSIIILLAEIRRISGQSFKWRPSFDSYDTTSFDLIQVESLPHCALLCVLKTICFSFYYNHDEQSCKLNSEIFWKTGTNIVSTWQYYEKNLENIAVLKTASQSSTHVDHPAHAASQAVDGEILDNMYGLRCSTTSYEVSPWLTVNMDIIYIVDFVTIFNRRDEKGERLHNVDIKLGPTSTEFSDMCGSFIGPAQNGQVVYIGCQTGSSGQFIRIQLEGNDGVVDNVLTICELEIHVQY